MKTWTCAVLFLITSLAGGSHMLEHRLTTAQTVRSLPDAPVGDIRFQEKNIHLALSRISGRYKVPIGLEVASADDLLNERSITVQLNGGTLGDVLNAVVSQCPLYTWKVQDGVINVFPTSGNRDPVLKAILAARIQDFYLEEGAPRFTFRQRVTSDPAVKSLLEENAVTFEGEMFSARDIERLGRGFSLKASNATVKTLLNRLIKESETKYWIINRDGAQKQYLMLNF